MTLSSGILVDNEMPKGTAMFGEGMTFELLPGEIHRLTCDISGQLKTPGKHKIQYKRDEALSNVIEIEVRTAP